MQGAGLHNVGNTCYLNSVLQCLTYTEPFVAYLQTGKHTSSCKFAATRNQSIDIPHVCMVLPAEVQAVKQPQPLCILYFQIAFIPRFEVVYATYLHKVFSDIFALVVTDT